MIGEVQYGGRVTDDFDKRLLNCFARVSQFKKKESTELNFLFKQEYFLFVMDMPNLRGEKHKTELLSQEPPSPYFAHPDNNSSSKLAIYLQSRRTVVSSQGSVKLLLYLPRSLP